MLDDVGSAAVHDHVFDEFCGENLERFVDIMSTPAVDKEFNADKSDAVHEGQDFVRLCGIDVHNEFQHGLVFAWVA